jgi:SNF2 family DNA or RNA helicase
VSALIECLKSASDRGQASLVFSQWTKLLDWVEVELKRSRLDWVRLDGSTRDRDAVVRTFQEPSGPPVFLISLTAGGTGLTATRAQNVFFLDPWWNPQVEAQAVARAHRIGTQHPVTLTRLVSEGTVESRVLELQESKKALFAKLDSDSELTGDHRSLDRADLLGLLGLSAS